MKTSTPFKMPSTTQIALWKDSFKELHKITPNPEKPEIFCIVRHPNISDITASVTMGGDDSFKTGFSQLVDCWLAGDERIKEDLELSKSAALIMGRIFKVYSATIDFLDVTNEVLETIPEPNKERALKDGQIRRLKVILSYDKNNQPLKTLSAVLHKPNISDLEKTETANNSIDSGIIFFQECLIKADQELLDGDDEIRFSAYLACNSLIRRFTATVEKL